MVKDERIATSFPPKQFFNSSLWELVEGRDRIKSKMHIQVAFEISDVFFYIALLALSTVTFCLLSVGILFSCLLLSRGMRPSKVPRLIFATVCCIVIAAGVVLGMTVLIAALRKAVAQKWLFDGALAMLLTYHARPNRIGEVLLIPLNTAFLCSTTILVSEGM